MNVIAFDDGPFPHAHTGSVLLVGAVCSRTRLDGVVSGKVRRDGTDSTACMIELVTRSQFREHVRAACLEIRRLQPSEDRDALEALAAGLAARPA